MSVAILGVGLASPAGTTVREHVFFPRISAPDPAPSPFLLEDDATLRVGYAPWIGARASWTDRTARLAETAAREALASIDRARLAKVALFFASAREQRGVARADVDAAATRLATACGATLAGRANDMAGAFLLLDEAMKALDRGDAEIALVVGADSFVSIERLAARVARPPNPWFSPPPIPAEGAAAIVIASEAFVKASGATALGRLDGVVSAQARPTDEDDEPIDGAAMSALVRALPAMPPIAAVFGQTPLDVLRMREWDWAVARNAARFDETYFPASVEEAIGDVGAASSAMNLAFGLALLRHGVAGSARRTAPFAAWGVSSDGTRAIAWGAAG